MGWALRGVPDHTHRTPLSRKGEALGGLGENIHFFSLRVLNRLLQPHAVALLGPTVSSIQRLQVFEDHPLLSASSEVPRLNEVWGLWLFASNTSVRNWQVNARVLWHTYREC